MDHRDEKEPDRKENSREIDENPDEVAHAVAEELDQERPRAIRVHGRPR